MTSERQVFAVGVDGAIHPSGTVTAPEPSRAIAKVSEPPPPAVEPPPPSLSLPQEEPKRTKPARRRRAPREDPGDIEGTASALTPPVAGEDKPRRTRKKADADSTEPKSKAKKSTTSTKKPTRKRNPTTPE